MDINDVRIGFTLLSLLAFLGIAFWAWQRQRRTEFEEAARLPFVDDEPVGGGCR